MVFDSDRSGSPKIFITERATKTDPWSAPVALAIPTSDGLSRPHLSEDRLRLYVQDMNRIYLTERASTTSPWGAPVAMADLNGGGAIDGDPWLTLDEHRIVFSSMRGTDAYSVIYEATR